MLQYTRKNPIKDIGPNRTSVSNGEAIDYYNTFYKLSKDDIEKYYGGNYPKQLQNLFMILNRCYYRCRTIWVKDKLQDMLDAMGGNKKDLELLINYLYFRAVYYDNSDQDIFTIICKTLITLE